MPLKKGPMEMLRTVQADPNSAQTIFTRLCEGETLNQIARSWECPKGAFTQWYTTKHADLFDAATKVWALDMAMRAVKVAKGQPVQAVDPEGKPLFDQDGKPVLVEHDVARDKLYVDTLLKLASKYDRQRFGETVRVEKTVAVTADAGLLGFAAELLEKLERKEPRVIEQEPMEALPKP